MSTTQGERATFRRIRRLSLAAALIVGIGGLLVWKLVPAPQAGQAHPAIAVRFTTAQPGYVTRVVVAIFTQQPV